MERGVAAAPATAPATDKVQLKEEQNRIKRGERGKGVSVCE